MPSEFHTLIDHLNESWRKQDFDAIASCFHEQAVLAPPDQGAPIVGRDAIVAVYREFHELAQLNRFEVTEFEVYEFPPNAICQMHFLLDYHLNNGEPHFSTGMESYLIQPIAGQLSICWRQQLIFTDEAGITSD